MEKYIVILLSLIFLIGSLYSQPLLTFTIADSANNPIIKVDQLNRIHAVWGTINYGVYYGVFDTVGQIILEKRRISDGGFIRDPSLALSQNCAVAVWNYIELLSADYINGQILPYSGDSTFENIQFNDDYGGEVTRRYSPDISYLNDSTFIVVWTGNGPDTPDTGVYGQIVTNSGQFIGNNLLLSDQNPDDVDHFFSRVVSDPVTGEFTVIWQDNHIGSDQLYGRFFYSDGTPKDSSFLISDNPQLTGGWNGGLARSVTGEYAVVWEGQLDSLNGAVQLWKFDSNGLPLGSSVQLNSSTSNVTLGATVDVDYGEDGTYVVVWDQYVNDIPKIFAQRFLADGSRLGDNFRVVTVDDSSRQFFPSIVLKEGKIYIAWQSVMGHGDEYSRKILATIIDFNNPQVALDRDNDPIPQEIYLHQNYPNPFNPTTTIQYDLPQHTDVQITIYDLLGREVTLLLSETQGPGLQSVQWNASNAPSGMYFYQIRAGGFVQTKKMVVLK